MRGARGEARSGGRLLVVGMLILIAIYDGHWGRGAGAQQVREALSRMGMVAGTLHDDETDPSRPWAAQVHRAVFEGSWIKEYVVRKVSEALGRPVIVEGKLEIDWTWPPVLRAEQVRVANAAWSPEPSLLDIRRLTCHIDLLALLQGRLVLPMLELVEPVVRLERSEQGAFNWSMPTHEPGADHEQTGTLPLIAQVRLRDGRVTYTNYANNRRMTATLTEVQVTTTGPEQRLALEGAGQLGDLPFQLTAQAGALHELTGTTPYPVHIHLVVGAWQGDLQGTIAQPLHLQGVAMAVSVVRLLPDQRPSPQAHGAQVPPRQAPYRLTGHLTRAGDVWTVQELTGTLGQSDLAGVVSLDVRSTPPVLEAKLVSHTLDTHDLMFPPGASRPPPSPGAGTTSDATIAPAVVFDVLPTRALHATLRFQGTTVVVADQTLHNVSAALALRDGHLSLRPVFDLAGGTLRAQITVADRGAAPPRSTVHAEMAHISVPQMCAMLGVDSQATGRLDGSVDLAASGRSLPQLRASLTGKAALAVRDPVRHTDVRITVATEGRSPHAPPRLRVVSQGQVRGESFHLAGHVGLWYAVPPAVPVHMHLRLGTTRAWLNGTLGQGPQSPGLAAQVALQGPDPAQLSALLPFALPSLPAYRLKGYLVHTGSTWTLKGFTGVIGASDLAGELSLDTTRGEHLVLRGDLSAQTVVVTELLGSQASQQPARGAPEHVQRPALGQTQRPERSQGLEASLRIRSTKVMIAQVPLEHVSTDLRWRQGRLVLTPTFHLAGGTVQSQMTMEDRGEAPRHTVIHATMTQVNVPQVLASLGLDTQDLGRLDGQIDLAASGHTFPQLLASLAGTAALSVHDPATHTNMQVQLTAAGGTPSTPPRLRLASQGQVRGEPVHLEGHLGTWDNAQSPPPVQVHLRLGETRAWLDGILTPGPPHAGLVAHVALQGPDPTRLSTLLPLSLPSWPAYRLEGRLVHTGSTWALQELQGVIGDSDVAGEVSLDTGGAHLVLHGDLQSQILVVDELTGYAPEKKPGRVDPEHVPVPAPGQATQHARAQALEVTLRFRSDQVIAAKVPLASFAADLRLHQGRLAFTPRFQLADGTVRAQVQIDTQATPLHSTVRAQVSQLNLHQFLSWLELRPEDAASPKTASTPETAGKLGMAGRLDGQVDLTGTGRSLADFLASANGNVLLSMAQGQLGRVLVELVGLDVAETIEKALARKKTYQLRCLVTDFTVHHGRMETQMFLVDTTDTKVIGGGFIDLRAKRLALKLDPKAKDFSLFSVQAPLYIHGPLATPAVGPKVGAVLRSLLMPVKLGTPEHADCHAILTASQRRSQTGQP